MQCRLALGLIAVLTLTATACGVNAVPSDDAAAAGAGTVRVETVTRVSVVGSTAETFEFRTTGIVDYAADRREDREESSGCRTITIGDVSYGELPDEGFPAGKHWVQSSGEAVDSEAVFEQSQQQTTDGEGGMTASIHLFGVEEPAPDQYLDYLREGAGEPERVGEEDVRGVPTTHYRGDEDVRHRTEAELETAGWKPANIERFLEGIEGTREVDVWVDFDGRTRRIVTKDLSPGAEEGMPGDWVTTTEYFDFGLATHIQPPAAVEVLDSAEWQRIVERRMREQLDEYRDEVEDGIAPLPGAFVPSTASDADSAQSYCRR